MIIANLNAERGGKMIGHLKESANIALLNAKIGQRGLVRLVIGQCAIEKANRKLRGRGIS